MTKKEKMAKKTKRQKDKGGWGDWLDEQNIWGKSISFAKYDNTPFSKFIGADCTDGDATIWTTKLALAPLQQLAAFADRVGRYHFLNFFDTISYFQVQGLSGKEAEIVRLVCLTSLMGKLPTACRLSFCAIFQDKNMLQKKVSSLYHQVSFSRHNQNRWKPAQTTLHGLTTRVKSGLKLLETRSQKGTAGFTYAGFAWNFKIVLSYPLFAATGAEWHFLCPGGKCPGRSTQEGSLPHRTHVGKRRVILNDSWCPNYNCIKRGIAPFTFFNDHVKALWGAQNIRGKKTFLSNNSWLEVGGLAPLTYTVNCKIFAYAGLFGACKQCYRATGFEANCTRDTKNHLFAPSPSLLPYLWGLWLLHFKSFKGWPAQHLSWARSCCRWGLPHTCRKNIFIIKQLTKSHHKQPSWDRFFSRPDHDRHGLF